MDADDWQHVIFALVALGLLTLASVVLTHVGQATNQKLLPEPETTGGRHGRTMTSVVSQRRVIASSMLFLQLLLTVIASSQIISLFDKLTNT